MGLREFMNNNSAMATVVAIVVLIVVLGVMYQCNFADRRSSVQTSMYFHDLNDGTAFVRSVTEMPPIGVPSGTYRSQLSNPRKLPEPR